MSEQATIDLRAQGPLEMLDAALLSVRRGGAATLLQAWGAAAPLALCAIAVYYFERVEGIRSLRPMFAGTLVLAFYARALLLGRTARAYALALRPSLPVSETPSAALDVMCTASVVGFGLWCWLWPLAGLCALAPFAVAALLPFMALRGAVAPSWLARATCAPERGLAAFTQAFDDTAGMRGVFLIVELLVLFGTIGLFSNLYALTSFALLLGHSLLGFDVAFVSSFISPDNSLVLLVLATATLVLLEPLRAAVSAHAFVDARSRRDGADLHAALDAAIAQSAPRSARPSDSQPPIVAALILLACASALAQALPASAQQSQAPETPDSAASEVEDSADQAVRDRLSRILDQREFRDFADQDSHTVHDLLERLFKWLDGLDPDRDRKSERASWKLPPVSPWLLMALCAAGLGAIAWYLRATRALTQASAESTAIVQAPGAQEPISLLDEAARLAALGDARGALRALYLATLSALDRARLIEYEPSKTNWQYTRSLPRGELRQTFAAFTDIFDRTWYGHEPASHGDYEQCRALADRICGVGQG